MLHARLQGDGTKSWNFTPSTQKKIRSPPTFTFKPNSDFHFPMSLTLVMNHGLGLGFQVGTQLHISKSKSDFPCLSLLGSDSKPSSLSLINGSLPSLLYSLCSLLISKPLLFILKQVLIFLYIKTVAALLVAVAAASQPTWRRCLHSMGLLKLLDSAS